MDRLRLVTIAASGRPQVVRDLNDGTTVSLIRDTLAFAPPQANTLSTASGRRFEGTQPVQQSHANATAAAEWYVGDGVMSQDAALELAEQIALQVNSARPDLRLEWRPEGASFSLFIELRGPGVAGLQYRWIEWQGTKKLHIKLDWSTAPLGQGAQTWIYEDWKRPDRIITSAYTTAANGLEEYTTNNLTAKADDATPVLKFNDTTYKQLILTGRGYKVQNPMVTVLYNVTATTATGDLRVILTWIDDNNMLYVKWNLATALLEVRKIDAGSDTVLATGSAGATPATGAQVWALRAHKVKDVITADLFVQTALAATLRYPVRTGQGASAAFRLSHTLSGANDAKFSVGALGAQGVGYMGIGVTPAATTSSILGWWGEPYVMGKLSNGNVSGALQNGGAMLQGAIPGTAPALIDVDVNIDTAAYASSNAQPWGLLSWWPDPRDPFNGFTVSPGSISGYTSTIKSPFGFFDGNSDMASPTAGSATVSQTGATGGNYFGVTATSGGAVDYQMTIDPNIVDPDDFTGNVSIELWVRLYSAGGLTSLNSIVFGAPALTSTQGILRYGAEDGSDGKLLNTQAGFKWHRLDILTFPVDKVNGTPWILTVEFTFGNASTGAFGLDSLVLVPSRARVTSPTSKINNVSYPKLIPSGSWNMRFLSDVRTQITDQRSMIHAPSAGVSGSPITLPGRSFPRFLFVTSGAVPDDPDPLATTEATAVNAQQFFVVPRVTPRYYLVRGTT